MAPEKEQSQNEHKEGQNSKGTLWWVPYVIESNGCGGWI